MNAVATDEIDLFYIGGGQDREQALVAHDLASKADALHEAVAGGAAVLAVCGGYQLLGHSYRDVAGDELPGIGLLPLRTIAGSRRMIGDVLLDCVWAGETLAGFENHAGRTLLDDGAEPLGRVISGFGNDGASGYEGCRQGVVYGTYLHGPLLPRNPWFADRLLADALARTGRAQDSRRCRTGSSGRPTPCRPSAPGRAAAACRLRAVELALRPLRADELPDYLSRGQESYARDMVANAGISEEAARTPRQSTTGSTCCRMGSPHPASSCSHSMDRGTGERVGDLWFAERGSDFGEQAAFIYSIEIFEEFRGRGLGRQAMPGARGRGAVAWSGGMAGSR